MAAGAFPKRPRTLLGEAARRRCWRGSTAAGGSAPEEAQGGADDTEEDGDGGGLPSESRQETARGDHRLRTVPLSFSSEAIFCDRMSSCSRAVISSTSRSRAFLNRGCIGSEAGARRPWRGGSIAHVSWARRSGSVRWWRCAGGAAQGRRGACTASQSAAARSSAATTSTRSAASRASAAFSAAFRCSSCAATSVAHRCRSASNAAETAFSTALA